MPNPQTAPVILFWCAIIGAAAAAIVVVQWMRKLARSLIGGPITPPLKYLRLLLIGLVLSLLCGLLGLWLVHRMAKPVSCPALPVARDCPKPPVAQTSTGDTPSIPNRTSLPRQSVQQTVRADHGANVIQQQTGAGGVSVGGNVDQSGDGCQQKIVGNGSNNANNCVPPQRHLTKIQKTQLSAVSSVIKSLPVYCYSTDKEGCVYAADFRNAFINAGMDEGIMVGMLFDTPSNSNVYLAFKRADAVPPAFSSLEAIFRKAGLDVHSATLANIPDGDLELVIGLHEADH
jgi:hypothetical protein